MSQLASVVLLNIYQEVAQEHSLKPPIIIAPKERSPVSDIAGEPFFSEQSYSQINHLFSHSDIPGRTSAKQKTPFGDDEHLLGGFEALSSLRNGNGLESFPISPLEVEKDKEPKVHPSALKMKLSLTPETQKNPPVVNKPKQANVMRDNFLKTRPGKKLERSNSLPVANKTFEFEEDDEDEEEIPVMEGQPQEGGVIKNKRLNLGDDKKGRRHSTMVPMKPGSGDNNKDDNNSKGKNSNMNNNKNKAYQKDINMRKRRSIMRAASLRPKKSHFYYLSMSFADVDSKSSKKSSVEPDDITDLPMNKNVNLICPPNDTDDDTPKKRKSRIEKDFELFKKRSYFSHFRTSSNNSNNNSNNENPEANGSNDDLFASEAQSDPFTQQKEGSKEIIESRPESESDSGSEEEEEECMADKLEAALRKRELEASSGPKKFQLMRSSSQVQTEPKSEPEPAPALIKSTFAQNKPNAHSRDSSASQTNTPKSPKVPITTIKQRVASVVDSNAVTKPNPSIPNAQQRPKTGVSSPTNHNFANKGYPGFRTAQRTEATSPETVKTLAKSNVTERTSRLASTTNTTTPQRQSFKSVEKSPPVENKKPTWNPYTKKASVTVKTERTSTTIATGPKTPLSKSGVTGATSPKNTVDSTPKAAEKQTLNNNNNNNNGNNELRSPDKSFTKNSPEVEELQYVHLKSFLEDGNQLDISMEEEEKVEPFTAKPEPIEPKKNPSGVYLKAISKILEEPEESPMPLTQQPLEPVSPAPKQYTEQSPIANPKTGFKGFQINPKQEISQKNVSTAMPEKKKALPPSLFEDSPKQVPHTFSSRTPKATTYTSNSNNSGPNTPSKAKARLAINQFQPKKPTVTTSYSAKNAHMKESSSRLNSETDAPTEQLISPKDTKPIYTARSPLRNLLGTADTEKQASPTKLGQKSSLLNEGLSKTNKTHSEFRNISSLYKKVGNTSISQPQQQPSPRYQSVYNQLPRNLDGTPTKSGGITPLDAEKLSTFVVSPRLKDKIASPSNYISKNSTADSLQKTKLIAASKGSPTNAELNKDNSQRSSLHKPTFSAQQKHRTGSPQYGSRNNNKWV